MATTSDVTITTASDVTTAYPSANAAEIAAFQHLSHHLAALLRSSNLSDVSILVHSPIPISVPVHRCLLAARSPFFRDLFARNTDPQLDLAEWVPGFDVGVEALKSVLEYVYTGIVMELPRGVAECADEDCGAHEACWPAVCFMLQVLYAAAVFQISELVNLFQRRLLDILEKVTVEDMLAILQVANLCDKPCLKLFERCIEIVVTSDIDYTTLENKLTPDVVHQIEDFCLKRRLDGPTRIVDKDVKSIYKALDADDVELVEMLLQDGRTTLDDANALHYAVAHCDSRVTKKLLELNRADVNRVNSRGYTVLHIAAMRKNPEIMMALLKMRAEPYYLTRDGRTAIQIAKRFTSSADCSLHEQGKSPPDGKLCIEMLERAEVDYSRTEAMSTHYTVSNGSLQETLLYLESRVWLAQSLYPKESKVAMDNAHVEGTLKFNIGSISNFYPGSKRPVDDDRDDSFPMTKENIERMTALAQTVELGRRFFPRCSKIIDKLLGDDLSELPMVENFTSEDDRKKLYNELQAEINEAFYQDKLALDASASTPSSKSARGARKKQAKKS